MAVESKVVDRSFRLGAGRYIQEAGAIERIGEELERLGARRVLVVHGKTYQKVIGNRLELLIREVVSADYLLYEGFCNKERCERIADSYHEVDTVIGVGGGNVLDAAKMVAAVAGARIVCIPTSSATCAAYTPLSVCYTDEGQTAGTIHHKCEVSCVLADMSIITTQPRKLLVAGVWDAMAKTIEIKHRIKGMSVDEIEIGLLSSYELSKFIYSSLERLLPICIDGSGDEYEKAMYDTIYLTICLTGCVSGMARGSNQCALAHKVYETSRTLFPRLVRDRLHGEMVAMGMIVQADFNGDEKGAQKIKEELATLGMTTSLSELGITPTEDNVKDYYNLIEASSALKGANDEDITRWRNAFRLIAT